MNWQPIETAPMDVPLIVWAKLYGTESAFVAMFETEYGWWKIQGVGGYEWETDIEPPTHWMPLPDPPSLTSNPKGERDPNTQMRGM